jgi:hypothetical protein
VGALVSWVLAMLSLIRQRDARGDTRRRARNV